MQRIGFGKAALFLAATLAATSMPSFSRAGPGKGLPSRGRRRRLISRSPSMPTFF